MGCFPVRFHRKDRLLTCIALIVCTVGMAWQTGGILTDYYNWPTIMNVVEEREAATFPALTICLSPWYNITMVCEKLFNGNCSKKDLMVTLSYPKHGIYKEYREAGLSDPRQLFTCNMTSFMADCPDFDCHEWLHHIYYRVPMMACYTLDLQRFLPQNHSYFHCPHTWSYELTIEAKWNPKTTLTSMDMGYYPVLLHESFVYPPEPMFSASMIKGQFTYYTMTEQRWTRLKKPYHTDCWDYRERYGLKEQAVFQGWMSQPSCEQKCRMAQELRRCGCVRTVNDFSHFADGELCDVNADDKCNAIMTANDSQFYELCSGVCNSECSSTRYDVRLSGLTSYHPRDYKQKRNEDLRCGFSISFSSASVEIFQLEPAMNTEMLFGVLAGFIGVWLGTSFGELSNYAVDLVLQGVFNDKAHDGYPEKMGFSKWVNREVIEIFLSTVDLHDGQEILYK